MDSAHVVDVRGELGDLRRSGGADRCVEITAAHTADVRDQTIDGTRDPPANQPRGDDRPGEEEEDEHDDENRELPAGVRGAVVGGRTDGGHATVERVEIGPQPIEQGRAAAARDRLERRRLIAAAHVGDLRLRRLGMPPFRRRDDAIEEGLDPLDVGRIGTERADEARSPHGDPRDRARAGRRRC